MGHFYFPNWMIKVIVRGDFFNSRARPQLCLGHCSLRSLRIRGLARGKKKTAITMNAMAEEMVDSD